MEPDAATPQTEAQTDHDWELRDEELDRLVERARICSCLGPTVRAS